MRRGVRGCERGKGGRVVEWEVGRWGGVLEMGNLGERWHALYRELDSICIRYPGIWDTPVDYMTNEHNPWISVYSEMEASLPTGSFIPHDDVPFKCVETCHSVNSFQYIPQIPMSIVYPHPFLDSYVHVNLMVPPRSTPTLRCC